MSQLGLQPVQKRRSRPRTTQSLHHEPIAPDRLNQLPLPPSAPNQVGVLINLPAFPGKMAGFIWRLNSIFVQTSGRLETFSSLVIPWFRRL